VIVTVSIEQRHIDAGAVESECSCAAALAMKEVLPGRAIEVWSDALYIDGQEIKPPPALVAFIADFDDMKTPGPISFELEVAEASA